MLENLKAFYKNSQPSQTFSSWHMDDSTKIFFFLITSVRRAVWLTDLLKPRDHSAEMKGKKGTRKLSEIFSSLFVEKVEKLLDQNSIPS